MNLVSLIGLAIFLALAFGSTPTSKAKGQWSNLDCKHDTGIVNGELDYGVTVSVTVKNVGQAGTINIKPVLSTSEGQWRRDQDLNFKAGESKTLTYFFSEPTINASNIQCRITVSPTVDQK